jgi:hypothetical protein
MTRGSPADRRSSYSLSWKHYNAARGSLPLPPAQPRGAVVRDYPRVRRVLAAARISAAADGYGCPWHTYDVEVTA